MGSASSAYQPRAIFLDIEGRTQKVLFSRYCSPSDIRELLCNTAGLARSAAISLLDPDNAIISIDPTMPSNTESTPYRVITLPGAQLSEKDEVFQSVLAQVAEQFSRAFKITELKSEVTNRLAILEKRVELEGLKVVEIEKCRNDIRKLRDEIAKRNDSLLDQKKLIPRRDVPSYSKYLLSEETVQTLRKPTFDAWHWEANEMLSCLEHMYHSLGLVKDFNINPMTLKRWLLCVHENYRNNPFHNFRHCFCVTQMMYSIIEQCQLQDKFTQLDILILMSAAVCHDLDHPGYNNTYQINARTELAVRYNDISPLENHHCAIAFQIFSQPECNIFSNMDPEIAKQIRQGIITLILATDMARHGEILDSFKQKIDTFDFTNKDDVTCLQMVLIKCCDISNEVRPIEVAEPWVDCLLQEYFMQMLPDLLRFSSILFVVPDSSIFKSLLSSLEKRSDREKAEGLPVAPFMDRDKVTKATAQIGFINFVLIPLFETVMKLFPQIEDTMVQPLRDSRNHYEELKQIDDTLNEVQKKKNESLTLGNKKK